MIVVHGDLLFGKMVPMTEDQIISQATHSPVIFTVVYRHVNEVVAGICVEGGLKVRFEVCVFFCVCFISNYNTEPQSLKYAQSLQVLSIPSMKINFVNGKIGKKVLGMNHSRLSKMPAIFHQHAICSTKNLEIFITHVLPTQ